MEENNSKGLTPEQNEEAIRLRSEHKNAAQELSYAVFDKARDLSRNPDLPTADLDQSIASAQIAYDDNLEASTKHLDDHLPGYIEQAKIDAEADGVDIVSSDEPNNTSDTNSDKYIDDIDKAHTIAIKEDPYRRRAAESRANFKTSDDSNAADAWKDMSNAFDRKADEVGENAAKRYDLGEKRQKSAEEDLRMNKELIDELKARRQEFGPADKNVEGASKELMEELKAQGVDPTNAETWKTIYITTKTILAREHDLASKGLPHPWSKKVISNVLLNLMPEELKSQLDD
jgi:hypothetical protein